MKKQYNNMIRFPDSEEPDLITVYQLLKFHQLVIDLPKAVMDAEVDACLKTADVSVYENQIIFKGEDYTVTINPNDPNKTIIEEDNSLPRYYSIDGSYHIDVEIPKL